MSIVKVIAVKGSCKHTADRTFYLTLGETKGWNSCQYLKLMDRNMDTCLVHRALCASGTDPRSLWEFCDGYFCLLWTLSNIPKHYFLHSSPVTVTWYSLPSSTAQFRLRISAACNHSLSWDQPLKTNWLCRDVQLFLTLLRQCEMCYSISKRNTC